MESISILDRNRDGKVDMDDFVELIYDLMKEQKKSKFLTGSEKKMNVLNGLRFLLGAELYDRYEPVLKSIIEFLFKNFFYKNCCIKTLFPCCN